jgi:hypothetical protein
VTDRNDPCPCGSGKKFKKCHGAKGAEAAAAKPDAKASAAKPSGPTPSEATEAKGPRESAPPNVESPDAAEPLHTHRAANPAKDESARKRHLQRRTDSPALRGSLFYKLKD